MTCPGKFLTSHTHSQPSMMSESGELSAKEHAVTTIASVDIDPTAERSLVRKFDFTLLPILAVMYLFNSLDKSNLGNAKTAGLEGIYQFFAVTARRALLICQPCFQTLSTSAAISTTSSSVSFSFPTSSQHPSSASSARNSAPT